MSATRGSRATRAQRPPPLDVNPVSAAAQIGRLKARLKAQARLIRQHSESLSHSRNTFERASATARIGVWECSLPNEALTWTEQVYDLFEFPRGSSPGREHVLGYYSLASLKTLQESRNRAIAERGGFNLDAEITTAKGRRRWIRITATVESEGGVPVRIFGMKQDITEEKLLYERTRYLADFDDLTGLANRSSFQAKLAGLDERRADELAFSALLLVDLDGFKQINDTFGHALGDECLRSAAARLKAVCREHDFVARVGGDEFAVLLDANLGQDEIEKIAAQIVESMRKPLNGAERPFKVGASVGIARIDTRNPVELFKRADAALYAAKAAGRDTFRTFGAAVRSADDARIPQLRGAVTNDEVERRPVRRARAS